MSRTKPDYRREKWLREKYVEERKTLREIAAGCDVCKSTIRNWVHKFDIETRSLLQNRRPEDSNLRDSEWLRTQYHDKERSASEIAADCDVDPQTVLRWLERNGIETRSPLETQRLKVEEELKDPEWLREEYSCKGREIDEIADEFDCSRTKIHYWLDEHDIKKRKRRVPAKSPLRDEEWLSKQYFEEKTTVVSIADECGVSDRTVFDWIDNHYGWDRREKLKGAEHPQWRGGTPKYGEGWDEEKREMVIERDNSVCQHAGCSMTRTLHREQYGVDIHVHHITKAKNISDDEVRNAPDNLVTLCIEHHMHHERIARMGLRPQFDSIE